MTHSTLATIPDRPTDVAEATRPPLIDEKYLRAFDWLRRGMQHIITRCEPPNLAAHLEQLDKAYEAIVAARAESDAAARTAAEQFMRKVQTYYGFPVYILMGFHGALLFEGDEFGFFEFDSPELAARKIRDILVLGLETGTPTNLEFEVSSLDVLLRRYPDLRELMKRALEQGLVEIINSTYAHPYSYLIGPESNIRQFEFGGALFEELCGTKPRVYACSEYAYLPQTPQILKYFGIEYSGLRSRLQGTGPSTAAPLIDWEGFDGTRIRALAHQNNTFAGEYYASCFYKEIFPQLLQAGAGSTKKYAVLTAIVDHTVETEDDWEEAFRVSRFGDVIGRHMTYSELFDSGPESYGIFRFPYDHFEAALMPYNIYCEGGQGHLIQQRLWELEAGLLQAEALLADMQMAGHSLHDAPEILVRCWRTLLLCQNHDSIAVPGYRQGQYHRERLHLNPEEYLPLIEPIPVDAPSIGTRTLVLLDEIEHDVHGVVSAALNQLGWQLVPGGAVQLAFNPQGHKLGEQSPGLALRQNGSAVSAPSWSVVLRNEQVCFERAGADPLKLQVFDAKDELQPWRTTAGQPGVLSAGVGLTLTSDVDGEALKLCFETTENDLRLELTGFPAGGDLWTNYPMGLEPTLRRNFTATGLLWMREQFLWLSLANPYYGSDLARTKIENTLHNQGRYDVTLLPDPGLSVAEAGSILSRHQLPAACWPVAATDGTSLQGPTIDSDVISVQAMLPHGDCIHLRLFNHSEAGATARVTLPDGWRLARQIDGQGNLRGEQPDVVARTVRLGAWRFGTFELVHATD